MTDLLTRSADSLLAHRDRESILYELLLKLGLELTAEVERKEFSGAEVASVGAGTLMACLVPAVSSAELESLALAIAGWHKQLSPSGESVIVFRDDAFPDDVAKVNLTAILAQHGLHNVRCI